MSLATSPLPQFEAVLDLLGSVWPGMPARVRRARTLGFDWSRVSRPYLAWSGDTAVAHVGVIRIPMFVGGLFRHVAGIHAVCTRPAHRCRGHMRRLLTTALVDVAEWTDTALLATSDPGLYAPFGFEVVRESSARVERPREHPAPPMRRLSDTEPSDVRLLRILLRERTPVSHRLAAMDAGWLFAIDELLETGGFHRLWYADDLEVVVAAEQRGPGLHLLDVVSRRMPELPELTGRLPGDYDRVYLHFPPDRLAPLAPADPLRWEETVLMVRGPFDAGPAPVALSPLARC